MLFRVSGVRLALPLIVGLAQRLLLLLFRLPLLAYFFEFYKIKLVYDLFVKVSKQVAVSVPNYASVRSHNATHACGTAITSHQ